MQSIHGSTTTNNYLIKILYIFNWYKRNHKSDKLYENSTDYFIIYMYLLWLFVGHCMNEKGVAFYMHRIPYDHIIQYFHKYV